MEKYYLIKTYGCQMNVHESEKLAGVLKKLKYLETDDMNKADVIVFNTCCIRDSAEQKILGNISAVKKLKKQKPDLICAVCGCMSQKKGVVNLFKEKYPYVNIVFGTHNIHEFKKYLTEFIKNKQKIYNVWDKEDGICESVEIQRSGNLNAFVNIMYGCNNFCSYCIVPYVRGRERSRKLEDVVAEVKKVVKQGYKTITLLGQNVNSYGNDFKESNINFAYLLTKICEIKGDFKIKFMSSHPKDFTDDVIKVIAKNKKMSKSIHLPIQSGSNKILKLMNRKYTKEHYIEIANKIKKEIPNCYLSTDFIVGFPGETNKDFIESYKLIESIKFNGIFAFMFSPRSGTVAENLPKQISLKVKNERVNAILQLSKSLIKEQNKLLINKPLNVLVEKIEMGIAKCVSDGGKTIEIHDFSNLKKGMFVDVVVTSVQGNKLIANIK